LLVERNVFAVNGRRVCHPAAALGSRSVAACGSSELFVHVPWFLRTWVGSDSLF
jgi:hypothetical protein